MRIKMSKFMQQMKTSTMWEIRDQFITAMEE